MSPHFLNTFSKWFLPSNDDDDDDDDDDDNHNNNNNNNNNNNKLDNGKTQQSLGTS